LISFGDDFELLVDGQIRERYSEETIAANFAAYEGKAITLPTRFTPGANFLREHRKLWGF
jgi:hypothetical protein